jgi:hypothetical protein
MEASNWLILFYVYGRQRVIVDHLSLVRIKPQLVVSNGAVLRGLGPLHYLIGVSLWISTTLIVIFLITKYLGPAWWNEVEGSQPRTGNIGWWIRALLAIIMMVSIVGLLPLVPALTLGAVATTIGIVAVRWLQTNVGFASRQH